jgi:hypothetical protein
MTSLYFTNGGHFAKMQYSFVVRGALKNFFLAKLVGIVLIAGSL